MATATPWQQDDEYQNWLRESVALLYLKEGIESFIDKRVSDFHYELHTTIPQPYSRHGPAIQQQSSQGMQVCTTCTHNDVYKRNYTVNCSSNVCNTWLQYIVSYHTGGMVALTNLKPQLWPTHPWEVAKWFMTVGSENVKSASDADVATILKLLKTCQFMDQFIKNQNLTLVEEVLDIRNRNMHSNNLKLSDDQLRQDTNMMIDLLKNLVTLTPTEMQSVQNAIACITKLQSKTMNLTRDKEVTALHSRMQAVDSELASLRGKCTDYDQTRQDLNKTEKELKSLNDDYKKTNTKITQLEELKKQFEKFLQDNDLVQDLTRMSVRLQEHDQEFNRQKQRLDQQDHKTDCLGQQIAEQAQTLDEQKEGIDQQDCKTDCLSQQIAEQGQTLDEQKQRLDQQDCKTDYLGEQIAEQGQTLGEQKERIDQQDHKTVRLDQQVAEQGQTLDEQKQRLNQQDHKTDRLGQQVAEQGQTLDEQKERIDQQDHKTDRLDQQVADHRHTLDDQKQKYDCIVQRIDEQDRKIAEQVKSKPGAPVAVSSRSWDEKCKGASLQQHEDLQAMLMSHYKHSCLQNPLENTDVGLEYMYVAPDIKVLRESMGRDGLGNVEEKVTTMSCKQVFYTKDYQCKNIYITGDAGTGKSMLCRNIVRIWCEIHGGITEVESEESESDSDEDDSKKLAREIRRKERKIQSKEDSQILSQFKLLFYITLRDSLSEYKITDMIQSQILQHYDIAEGLKASDLLKKECCLVICDGLDEWVCPEGSPVPHFVNSGIPGRDITIETSIFMTTTRPWKLDVLQLKSSEVDKHIALIGISEQSARQLCTEVIKFFKKSKTCDKKKKYFFRTLNQRSLGHFKTIPVILVQLICLWFDEHTLPKSQVQLYCEIIEHLLKKAKKNVSTESISTPIDVQFNRPLPECFRDRPFCQSHQKLIYCLSKIAFEALFGKRKENSLVFKSSQLEIFGLGQEAIDLCLKSGILSQSKMLDKVSVKEKKISFLHKKLQEFFASLFIASYVDSEAEESSNKNIKLMTDFCSTLDTCLEMSQVYMFLSGLRQDLTQQLLTHFTHVVTADKHKQTHKYRQEFIKPGLIQAIQTCINDCVVEGSYYGYTYVNICRSIADFYITKTTLCHAEPLFLCTESSKVKYVYMETEDIDRDQLTAITSQLQRCHSVQKLHLFDLKPCCIHVDTLTRIVNNNINTLTYLQMYSDITATDTLVTAICSISSECLMALWLGVCMKHKHKEQIIARFSQSPPIRQLGLALVCTDHGIQCRARIDLSTMTHIQLLVLGSMSVDNLQSVSHSVERVRLVDVTLPVTALHEFTRSISKTTRYVSVVLDNVTVTEDTDRQTDMETFFRTCQGLEVIKCQYDNSNKTWSIDFTRSPQ